MYIPFSSVHEVLDQLHHGQPEQTAWLLMVAECHAPEMPALIEQANMRQLSLCGAIFPALISDARRVDEGIIAMPLPFDALCSTATIDRDQTLWHGTISPVSSRNESSALILVDCQARGISGFLSQIYNEYGNGISYAGAGTGFSDLRAQPSVFTESGFIENGGLLVRFPHPSVTSVRHGWRRVAGPFIATRTSGSVIQELNWESAGTFYRQQIAELSPGLEDKPIFPTLNSLYPLSIGRPFAEDVMRDPIEINDADEIVTLSDVPENSMIYIETGDRESLIEGARQAVSECSGAAHVSTCFVSDCYSRALKLEDALNDELQAAGEALKAITAVPMEGVLALGEVCGNERSTLEFYNKTFVISLLTTGK